MERIKGESSTKELIVKFDLEELLINQNINGELCPTCRDKGKINFIAPKYSRRNRQFFYSCSVWPECDFTANIKTRNLEDLKKSIAGRSKKRTTTTKKVNGKQQVISETETQVNLSGNRTEGRQWESKLLYWSSVKLPGYTYSNKKNAWWKRK